MDKHIYDYTKQEEKQLNSLYAKLMNSEWKDHDRRLVLITFLFYIVRIEERDVENPITSKQDLFHHIYIKLESMRQVNVRLRVLKVMEETFKDISFFDVTFKVLIDGMRELIHGVSDFKVDRYLEYLYIKEAKTIKEQKGGGVVFTPLSVSYFIETFIHQYLGDSLNQKEMKILEPCIGTGQLSSVFRREKYYLDGVEIDDDNLTITVLKTWLFNSDQEQVYTYDFLNQNKDDDVLLDVRYDVGICNPPYSSLVNRNNGEYKKVAVNELEFIERLCERVDGLVFALVPYYCINPPRSKAALKQSFDRLRYDYLLVSLVFFTRDIFYPSAMVDTVLMVFDTRHRGIVGKALEDGDRVYLDPIRIVLDDVDFTDIHRNRKKVWTHWCDWLETFNLDVWSDLKLARHPEGYLIRKQPNMRITEQCVMLPLSQLLEVRKGTFKEDEEGVLVNYVSSAKENNGVNTRKKVRPGDVIDENAITIGKFGAVFWQKEPFVASREVLVLVRRKTIGHPILDGFFEHAVDQITYFTELFGRSFSDYESKMMSLEVPISVEAFIMSAAGFGHRMGTKTKTEDIMANVFKKLNEQGIDPTSETWSESLWNYYIEAYLKAHDKEQNKVQDKSVMKITTKNGGRLMAPKMGISFQDIMNQD